MLGLETTQLLVFSLGILLVIGGLYGLWPLVLRWKGTATSIRIRQKDLSAPSLATAPANPPEGEAGESPEEISHVAGGISELAATESHLAADLGLVEELFAELFMLRTTLAELTSEVHSLRDEARTRQPRSRAGLRAVYTARRLRAVA